MSSFTRIESVRDLHGGDLDAAVCLAGKEWIGAERWFPTMTLDPKFMGFRIIQAAMDGPNRCVLIPRNSFRQDPQRFSILDPYIAVHIIEREGISLKQGESGDDWRAETQSDHTAYGPTFVHAAMRAFVLEKLGNSFDLPDEFVDRERAL